jgi:hypothetical protein
MCVEETGRVGFVGNEREKKRRGGGGGEGGADQREELGWLGV